MRLLRPISSRHPLVFRVCLVSLGLLAACGGGGGIPDPVEVLPSKRVVYQKFAGAGGTQLDLYSVREDGTGEVALAASQDDEELAMDVSSGAPVPAILGDRIIYRRRVSGTQDDIYSVRSDGTGTVALAATVYDERLLCVLGDRLVISKVGNGFQSIKADGTGLVTFPADAEYIGSVFGRIFFNSALAAGTTRFYSALPDGTAQAQLLTVRGQLVQQSTQSGERLPLTSGFQVFYFEDASTTALFASHVDGTSKALLASNPAYLNSGISSQFSVGAFGWPVADRFVYQTVTAGQSTVFSVKLDGTSPVNMGTQPGSVFFSGAIGTRAIFSLVNAASLFGADITSSLPTTLATGGSSGMTSGNRVIVIRNYSSPTFDFSSINPDGTAPVSLATAAYEWFSTSGDPTVSGRALVFAGNRILCRKQLVSPGTTLTPDVFSLNNDGTGLVALAIGGEKDAEHLGSDRLYFRRVVGLQSDLYSILLDGTGLVTLANGATDERFGLLSGTKVVFTRQAADGHRNLYIVNGDGTSEKLLSNSAQDKIPVAAL